MAKKENPIICKNCNENSGIMDGIYMDVTKNCDKDGNLLCENCKEIVFVGTKVIMEDIECRARAEIEKFRKKEEVSFTVYEEFRKIDNYNKFE